MATIVGEGTPEDRESIPLGTKRGNWIPNTRRRERAPDSMRAAERLQKRQCPSIETRSLSATYNCVGLVFGARRTWIDPSELDAILRDDGFRQVRDRSDLVPGDLVLYETDGSLSHVGIVAEVERDVRAAEIIVRVLSQWGGEGEYFHREEEVPRLLGQPTLYVSERRVLT